MTPLVTLRDIHLPALPLAVVMAALILLLLLAIALRGLHLYRRRRPLRCALRILDAAAARHARDGDTAKLAGELSQLLRSYAQLRFPEEAVAGLTGQQWLAFLDAHGDGSAFQQGAGAVLAWLPYSRGGDADCRALLELARRWLETNR